jgi:hypothetical protein
VKSLTHPKTGERRSRHPGGTDKAVRAHSDRSRAGRADDALHHLYKFIELVWRDLQTPAGLSPRFWLRSWRKGFCRFSFRIYGLEGKASDGYMSDVQALRTLRINSLFREMIDNKAVFHALMIHHGFPVPELHGLIRGGRYFAFGSGVSMPAADIPDRLLPAGGRLAVKPVRGHSGAGFLRLSREESGVAVNGTLTEPGRLETMLAGLNLRVVTGFVAQGRYGAGLFPDTTNTLRIVTLIDPDAHEPFIARVVQRIGNSRSFPVDNFDLERPGLCALVDLASGRLGPGVTVEKRWQVARYDRHPETGGDIAGVEIPNWPDIRRGVLDCARRFAFVPCIAWDIAVTEPGFTIIEGNSSTGVIFLQVHGPLLADPRVRRFYTYHRVVR